MRVEIFKSKFNEIDFDPKDTETAIEKFQDEINDYLRDLEKEGYYEVIDIKFTFFENGCAIAVMKYESIL
ncbi:hypothetical protein MDL80_06865 [Streptococcus suis]|uniref:hypothetical protein n=1 Tax=Streptococcus suis TaxID=1307 RepID=UPI0009423797|nr:hypothetical protein [Streptococcus suis]MBS8081772.1 hypothetical protein [Streptococcus suis]MCB2862013.1 hypothetical protein [Streptococcus suis]MCB2888706.1 hypothetical protein [Streptococcus suis]MCG9868473.1 hypothetical protein [Streptococcus suis]MCG9870531.1 hypothetical protein [Streptococcus suis]